MYYNFDLNAENLEYFNTLLSSDQSTLIHIYLT